MYVPVTQPWRIYTPDTDLNLKNFIDKQQQNSLVINAISNAYITETYENHKSIYTDGSVIGRRAGSAVITGDNFFHWRLPDGCSIFRAELFAIEQALKFITTDSHTQYTIYSDSLCCINKLSSINLTNLDPVLAPIADALQSLTMQKKRITVVWIPAHVGITGNEAADKLAKQATFLPQENIIPLQVTADDCFESIRSLETSMWQHIYDKTDSGSHYKKIEPKVSRQIKMQLHNRRSDVLISRLRLGRCLSNATLYQFNVRTDDLCDTCQVREDICHLLTCPANNYLHMIQEKSIYKILADVTASQTLAKHIIASKRKL